MRSPTLRMAATFIAPLLLALLFLLEIWGVRGKDTGQPPTEPAPSAARSGKQREMGLPFVIGPPLLSHPEGES